MDWKLASRIQLLWLADGVKQQWQQEVLHGLVCVSSPTSEPVACLTVTLIEVCANETEEKLSLLWQMLVMQALATLSGDWKDVACHCWVT